MCFWLRFEDVTGAEWAVIVQCCHTNNILPFQTRKMHRAISQLFCRRWAESHSRLLHQQHTEEPAGQTGATSRQPQTAQSDGYFLIEIRDFPIKWLCEISVQYRTLCLHTAFKLKQTRSRSEMLQMNLNLNWCSLLLYPFCLWFGERGGTPQEGPSTSHLYLKSVVLLREGPRPWANHSEYSMSPPWKGTKLKVFGLFKTVSTVLKFCDRLWCKFGLWLHMTSSNTSQQWLLTLCWTFDILVRDSQFSRHQPWDVKWRMIQGLVYSLTTFRSAASPVWLG